ncbi:chemotaxis protein CheD [Desulfobacterales bacterium HSG16]|nr:chemotaxis protein CheD [Desulfobacterales bacterium HSG16]
MPPSSTRIKKVVRIHIGQYHASRMPVIIYTLLGSCVAVCLYDPVRKIGGMNHIFLPGKANMNRFDAPARYGVNAMELLINRIMNLGGKKKRFVAKVFGGAHLLPSVTIQNGVGQKIVEFVIEFLKMESIRIVGKDVGGYQGRKIFYHTDTGEVLLKKIKSTNFSNIVKEEKQQKSKLKNKFLMSGEIYLFKD